MQLRTWIDANFLHAQEHFTKWVSRQYPNVSFETTQDIFSETCYGLIESVERREKTFETEANYKSYFWVTLRNNMRNYANAQRDNKNFKGLSPEVVNEFSLNNHAALAEEEDYDLEADMLIDLNVTKILSNPELTFDEHMALLYLSRSKRPISEMKRDGIANAHKGNRHWGRVIAKAIEKSKELFSLSDESE